jgi:hypothetical protein
MLFAWLSRYLSANINVQKTFNAAPSVACHAHLSPLNPFCATRATWGTLSQWGYIFVAQKGLIWTLISWVKCSSERMTGSKSVSWWADVGRIGCEGWAAHKSDIHPSLHHRTAGIQVVKLFMYIHILHMSGDKEQVHVPFTLETLSKQFFTSNLHPSLCCNLCTSSSTFIDNIKKCQYLNLTSWKYGKFYLTAVTKLKQWNKK